MRPLLVLLLVLAALAALVFGILSLVGDPVKDGGTSPPPVATPDDPSPSPVQPLESAPSDPDRVETAVTDSTDERTRATSSAAEWQYDNELKGTVLNPEGQPVPGAQVDVATAYEIFFVQDTIDTSQDATTRTDAQGRFTFSDLEPRAQYKLTVRHPQYSLKEVFSVGVGEHGAFEEPPITLSAGAVFQGYVKDSADNKIDGATLVLDGLMYQGTFIEPPDRMTATTDATGFYSFSNVPAGQRSLMVSAPGYGSVTVNGLNFDKDSKAPVNRDIQLEVGEMIRGRVVCAGQGLPGVTVQALGFTNTTDTSRGAALTDAAGQFVFESLTPGDYNLIAGMRGYRFDPLTRIHTGSDNVTMEGFKEADVCGHVIDAVSGAPITSFTCRMRMDNGPDVATSISDYVQTFNDPKGEFCMNGVPTGPWVIEAFAPGYAPSFSTPISVTRGQAPSGNVIRLSRGGVIVGRIVDPDGKPVPRARITTHDRDWSDDSFSLMMGNSFPSDVTQLDVRCREDGRFTLSGLKPGAYQMHIRAAGFVRYIQNEISVSEGDETPLGDIRLSRGGALRGTLFDPSGKPLVGGSIHVISDDGRVGVGYSAKSVSGGSFHITNIAPGRYLVSGARGGGPEANPIEYMQDVKNSQKQVTITEDNTTVVEMTLSQ